MTTTATVSSVRPHDGPGRHPQQPALVTTQHPEIPAIALNSSHSKE